MTESCSNPRKEGKVSVSQDPPPSCNFGDVRVDSLLNVLINVIIKLTCSIFVFKYYFLIVINKPENNTFKKKLN